MKFADLGLEPQLVRALEEQGYTIPTPIQEQSIPHGLAGRDVVGSAQTGTGKTAAFLLPILQKLRGSKAKSFRALILVPTRELAEQVLESAKAYGAHCGTRAVAVYGGVAMGPQTQALQNGTDIVIATPGRFLDHMERGHVNMKCVQFLVLDEADRMLDMGFAPAVGKILDTVPTERQTLLFSATVSRDVDRLVSRALKNPATVEIGRRAETAEGVEHLLVAVDREAKRSVLQRVLEEVPDRQRALIFTRTKHGADKVSRFLRRSGTDVAALHGGKTQRSRNEALSKFKSGAVPVLVATDVAARGIDVDNILMVVNYDVPVDPEVYVHRVGRTARAGGTGVAVTLMSPEEWLLMRDIEKLMGKALRRDVMPGFEPSVLPAQPKAEAVPSPHGRSVRLRRGGSRRR